MAPDQPRDSEPRNCSVLVDLESQTLGIPLPRRYSTMVLAYMVFNSLLLRSFYQLQYEEVTEVGDEEEKCGQLAAVEQVAALRALEHTDFLMFNGLCQDEAAADKAGPAALNKEDSAASKQENKVTAFIDSIFKYSY